MSLNEKENRLLQITPTTCFIYLGSRHKRLHPGTALRPRHILYVSCVASSSVCYPFANPETEVSGIRQVYVYNSKANIS